MLYKCQTLTEIKKNSLHLRFNHIQFYFHPNKKNKQVASSVSETIKIFHPKKVQEVNQPFETERILLYQIYLTKVSSNLFQKTLENRSGENNIESMTDPLASQGIDSISSDLKLIFQICRGTKIRQNSSSKLISTYLTDINPQFSKYLSELAIHLVFLAQALQNKMKK